MITVNATEIDLYERTRNMMSHIARSCNSLILVVGKTDIITVFMKVEKAIEKFVVTVILSMCFREALASNFG
jgi:deoxyribodipyrimidine photolyase